MIDPKVLHEIALTHADQLEAGGPLGDRSKQNPNFLKFRDVIAKGMHTSLSLIIAACEKHGYVHRDKVLAGMEKRRDKYPSGDPEWRAFDEFIAVLRGQK